MTQTELAAYITQQIKQDVERNNPNGYYREPLIGFSSADDPLYKELKTLIGPQHLYPQDILPEVKTIVSFFVPFSEKVVKSNRVGQDASPEWAATYYEANQLINSISEKLKKALCAQGIQADTVGATHAWDEETMRAPWSHRSAAFIAGLGRFGLNRLLITEKGCAGRYGSVFIAEELVPTSRSTEERCLYYRKGTCRYCLTHCVRDALSENTLDVRICYDQCLHNDRLYSEVPVCDVCGKCAVGPCAYYA